MEQSLREAKQVLSYSRSSPHFMAPSSLLPHSQEPTTCFCPESDHSRPCPPSLFLGIYFNIILPSVRRFSKWPLSSGFPNQNPACTSPLPIRTTCPTCLIYVDLTTWKTFGEAYRSEAPCFFSLLHSLVISSLLGQSILLSALLSYTHSVRDHVPCPCKTTGKIIVLYILIFIFMDSKLENMILHWLIASIPCIQLCSYLSWRLFLGTFAKLQKATRFIMSIYMEYLSSHWMDFCEILYLNFFFFNLSRKFKIH